MYSIRYNNDRLQSALREIRENGVSIRKASEKYSIPKSTLHDKIAGRFPEELGKKGPASVLTTVEENKIVEWCTSMTKCGFPIKRDQLLDTVKKIILDDGRDTPFQHGRPGKKWLTLFLRRNPQIVFREPEGISKGRAHVTKEGILKWFRDLKDYLKEMNAESILNDPRRILNGDETGFSLCPKTGKVLAPKGYKNVYKVNNANEKEIITVLLVFTASGDTVVPMVVFPYVRPPKIVVNSMPPDWFLGRSQTGWMNSEIFFEYIANGVHSWLNDKNIPRPVLLFVDGHKSHLTLELSEFCSNNQIILYALPPNATHLIQPADVSVFKPLKSEWKKTLIDWQRNPQNINACVTKTTFCPLLNSVLKMENLPESIKNGFRKCGLYPFNPESIDFSKCIKNTIENFHQEQPISVSPQSSSYDIAKTVIEKISSNLIQKGINPTTVIEEILREKDKLNTNLADLNQSDIEFMSNINLNDLEPGIYDLVNGSLIKSIDFNQQILSENETETITSKNLPLDQAPTHLESDSDIENVQPQPSTSGIRRVTGRRISEASSNCSTPTSRPSSSCSASLDKYLRLPTPQHIFTKSRKYPKDSAPRAISSELWRNIQIKKERDKEEKMNAVKMRKEERLKRRNDLEKKKGKILFNMRKKKLHEDTQSKKIQCSSCKEQLVSDVEDECLKNVGCDICLRWYHLKCTEFNTYREATDSIFVCQFCLPK